jgi:hypothetical protein
MASTITMFASQSILPCTSCQCAALQLRTA